MKTFSLVSAVITTKNEEAVIEDILESLKKQSYRNIEIVIVDNNSVDNTLNVARKHTSKVFNYGPERSSQRNFGVSKSKGVFILILDADMKLEKDVVLECVEFISKNKEVGAVIIPEKSYGRGFWTQF